MKEECTVTLFIDEDVIPVASFTAPVHFELDTTKLTDGDHVLKIISTSSSGEEGIKSIPFEVNNGPAISVDGIKKNQKVDGVLPLMINAYAKGNQSNFLITGAESPRSIPSWIWVLIISLAGWAMYFLVNYWNIKQA